MAASNGQQQASNIGFVIPTANAMAIAEDVIAGLVAGTPESSSRWAGSSLRGIGSPPSTRDPAPDATSSSFAGGTER